MSGIDANGRVEKALRLLTPALQPIIERELRRVYRGNWQQCLSVANGSDPTKPLDAYAALKTMIDNWQSCFKDGLKPKTRTDVSKALDGRNAVSHAAFEVPAADAISYLTAIRDIAVAISAKSVAEAVAPMIDDQIKAAASAMGVAPEMAAKKLAEPAAPQLDLGDGKYTWKPWRDVAPPHPDVMAARFVEAEFAADLSTVARGEGAETYRDPREFFRITYMTGGLKKVLRGAVERLAGKGGDPVIGLQTSFGGGKTHTMLALYHLASAKNAEALPGLAEVFKEAGVTTLPMRSKPVVFVGTASGANQPIPANGGSRTVKSLWGKIAVDLGGWKAYEKIKASDEARTNPGSEALIPILKDAAPCLILLDEVVAYARNLDGIPYDGFVSFFQSLTEAAKAVPGVLVVGSLPESGAEVGDQRGRDALLALEKVFGRVQSAWTPAQGTETFEIIRRRLFQELDADGEKAREAAVKAFVTYYKNNTGEFPNDVRERVYETQLMAAYPVHPELFRLLQTDWGGLPKFQKTRGVLKMMAQIVYRLWRDQHAAPMILPGDVPLTDDKVRTNALVPIPTGYDAVIAKEVAGDLSKPAQIEARSPSVGKNKAVTRAATALFMATSPHGSTNRGIEIARLRMACAIPGEQPSQFSEAIRRLGENAAYLYSSGENYWFSPIASLNQEAEDRARGYTANDVEAEIISLIRGEEKLKGTSFLRVHGAPDDPLGIDDAYEAALVILPPAAWQRGRDADTPAMRTAADIVEHKGPGQRRNRNRLAFLAADQAALEDVQSVVRKKLAWASIVRDGPRHLQLPPAQQKDAEEKAATQATAALNAVRRGWKHLLLPQEPVPGSLNAARGFDMETVMLANRANDPDPLPQLAWKKCEADGLIVSRLGVLDNDLAKVWFENQPHVRVADLRDWFARVPSLSKLREPMVLAKAISEALPRSDAKYGVADRFDEARGEYMGFKLGRLVEVDFTSDMLLVRRSAAEAQLTNQAPPEIPQGNGATKPPPVPGQPPVPPPSSQPQAKRPRRFYAKVTLDPNRPTPQVSHIAQSILSELDRTRGTTITLTLDIDAEAPEGFAEDVEAVVRDNAASLRITDFGFEGE